MHMASGVTADQHWKWSCLARASTCFWTQGTVSPASHKVLSFKGEHLPVKTGICQSSRGSGVHLSLHQLSLNEEELAQFYHCVRWLAFIHHWKVALSVNEYITCCNGDSLRIFETGHGHIQSKIQLSSLTFPGHLDLDAEGLGQCLLCKNLSLGFYSPAPLDSSYLDLYPSWAPGWK